MPPRIPYKITLTPAQQQAIKDIGTSRVLFFDDTITVCIDKVNKTIDLLVFNSLEMMGVLVFKRKIGQNIYVYKISNDTLLRVKDV